MRNLDFDKDIGNFEEGVEFDSINFCNIVNTFYTYRELMGNKAKKENLKVEVYQMAQYENYLCLGMTNGEIVLAKASAFHQEGVDSFGKVYKAHLAEVDYMQVSCEYIYTGGFKNRSIMCWKLQEQKEEWDYDTAGLKIEDQFCEDYSKERLSKYMTDVFPKRK